MELDSAQCDTAPSQTPRSVILRRVKQFSRQVRGWGKQDKVVSVKMWGEQVEYSKQILCFIPSKTWKLGEF